MVGAAQQRHAQDYHRLIPPQVFERTLHNVVHGHGTALEALAHRTPAPAARRGDCPRIDRQDLHTAASLVGPQGLAGAQQKGLRRGVAREIRLRLKRGRGRNDDGGAMVGRRHRVDEELGQPHNGLDNEAEHSKLCLERRALLRLRVALVGTGREREIDAHGMALDPVPLGAATRKPLERLSVLGASRDHQVEASPRELAGEDLADPRRGARHESGLPRCGCRSPAAGHGRNLPARLGRGAWVLCVAAALLCAAASPARGDSLPTPAPIARDGFGDARNSYAWSMAWFKGALYVGTARSAMCVENATIAYYLPDAGFYSEQPGPGVTCPPAIHQADLRAEIWRYEPRSGHWTRVYRSPRIPNPRAPGRLVARDIGYRGMLVHTERGGRKALYVAALSPDEFIPELRRPRPPRILRTTDGKRFRALRARPPIIHTYLGPYRPVGFRALATVGGSLYVTASAGLTGDGVVLRVRRPGGSSPSFEQVSPPRLAVFELAAFGGRLYAGTGDRESGYGVWRADRDRPRRWSRSSSTAPGAARRSRRSYRWRHIVGGCTSAPTAGSTRCSRHRS